MLRVITLPALDCALLACFGGGIYKAQQCKSVCQSTGSMLSTDWLSAKLYRVSEPCWTRISVIDNASSRPND